MNSITSQAYQEAVTYDPNGNIITYLRNGANQGTALPLQMDNLTYTYKTGTNQLTSIADAAATANYSTSKNNINDIDQQSANNYGYDEIGNMTSDVQAGITGTSGITWNVYGKILSVAKSTGTISYSYDATGNRISKTSGNIVTTYVRDAQGNVLAVYQRTGSSALQKIESHIYGRSRIGIAGQETTSTTTISLVSPYQPARLITFTRGEKVYELTNHLGNVLVTISDKKLAVISGSTIITYNPDVVTASDYYPFGMQMPGRTFNASGYRYGFNGKENDNDVKGDGNEQDYGMRIYDPRIGRFLSVDPLTKGFPWYTPYQFAGNKPILCIDLDGLEDIPATNGEYYTIDKLVNEAQNDVIVHEAKKRGESVVLVQDYLVIPNGHYNVRVPVHREVVLQVGAAGKAATLIYQDNSTFYENGNFATQIVTHYKSVPLKNGIPIEAGVKIPISVNVTYQQNSLNLYNADEAAKQIKPIADYLIAHPDAKIEIAGNSSLYAGQITPIDGKKTDETGKKYKTEDLMKGRAESLKDQLVKLGVNSKQITTKAGKAKVSDTDKSNTNSEITITPPSIKKE